jgi:hypothetical protein
MFNEKIDGTLLTGVENRSQVQDSPFGLIQQRTAEPQNFEFRISKGGFAMLNLFNKTDRIHSFNIRHSSFDILSIKPLNL